MIDSLLVGHSDGDFEGFVNTASYTGSDTGAFKDLDLGLSRYSVSIREEVAFNPEARVHELRPGTRGSSQHIAADSYLSEAFDF